MTGVTGGPHGSCWVLGRGQVGLPHPLTRHQRPKLLGKKGRRRVNRDQNFRKHTSVSEWLLIVIYCK